jgi:hypothetical protein
MPFTLAIALISLAVIGLTGYVFALTYSPWSFLLLILLFGVRTFFQVKCPKCGEEFYPFYDDAKKGSEDEKTP